MDKDKPPVLGGGGGLPPHSSRYTGYSSPSGSAPLKRDPFPSPSPSIPAAAIPESREGAQFSHDVNRMPDYPPRNVGHRRAQSEILSLPDDINFDSDLGVVGSGEGPSLSDETEEDLLSMYLDIEKFTSSATSGFDLLGGEGSVTVSHPPPPHAEGSISTSNERPRIRHQHSQSMDGYTSIKPELLASSSEGPSSVETKKAVSAAKLADLALIDPKRAKRIWANRQSAARSKERKMRYIAELERKVQTLQTEATTLSAQLTLLQRDTNGLTAENNELKLRVQSMEQQVHLQDALNDALREEVQRLKVATGQPNFSNGGPLMSFGTPSFRGNQQQHFYHNNQAMQPFLAAQQLQQLQIHSQHQLQVHPYQQQPPAELKLKGAMASQTQRESTSDNSSTPSER